MKIDGNVIVVTGGVSGLGQAAVRCLHAQGAKVVAFDLNDDAGAKLVEELGEGRFLFCHTDVTCEESVAGAIEEVTTFFGTIHACINAAGIPAPCKILEKDGSAVSLTKFTKVVDVNLNGVFNVMSKCAAVMAKNDPQDGEERGVIINISSGAAFEGQIGQCGYASSKNGVIGLNMPASRELGRYGIRVNSIAPGLFGTPMVESLGDKIVQSLTSMVEAPKRLGQMDEFAHCCQFIIENGYINGTTIRIDAATRLKAS